MNGFLLMVEIFSGIGIVFGAISAFFVWIKRLVEGQNVHCKLLDGRNRYFF
jgi:hypothetical protein